MSRKTTRKGLLHLLDQIAARTADEPAPPMNLSQQEAALFANPTKDEEYGCASDHRLPRCQATTKVSFPSKNSAKNALRIRQRRGAGFLRTYWCDHCHAYHLTSSRFDK